MNFLEKAEVGIDNLEVIITLTVLGVFIGSILLVLLVKFILVVRKQIKMNKKFKHVNATYLPIFGGLDNIKRIDRQLNRVLVEVIDVSLVNIEELKVLNVGTQITGNVIKCSSKEMADELEKYKK
jgi:phosphotransferase system IIB component